MQNKSALILYEELKKRFKNCDDYSSRYLDIKEHRVYISFIGNVADRSFVSQNLLNSMILSDISFESKEYFFKSVSSCAFAEIKESEIIDRLFSGDAIFYADVGKECVIFTIPARAVSTRSVSEPDSEVVIRGSREGFVENAAINISLIRKRLRTPDFKVEKLSMGKITNTEVYVMYIEGIASRKVLKLVKERMSKIDIPSCIDSGYIEQFIQESRYPFFSTVGNSEKPDKVAAKLIEGRVAVMCDGSPTVLTVPYIFSESLQSSDDYMKTPYYATFLRFLRLTGTLISVFLPSVYIAILEYHREMIPFELYETIIKARQNLPFGVFSELVIILIIFEIIREVGLRMPKAVGNAVSIVGGLILGDAAISAGIASAPVIIIASLTAICAFINPPYSNSIVILRFFFIAVSNIFGIFGVIFSFIALVSALCRKSSYGVPYLFPVSPLNKNRMYDFLFMFPRKAIKKQTEELK